MGRGVAVAVAVGLLVAGCSGDDGQVAEPTSQAPASTSASPSSDTTAAAPTTSSAPLDPSTTTLTSSSTTAVSSTTTEATTDAEDRIVIRDVSLPDGVGVPSQQNSAGFTADGALIYFSVTVAGVEGRHIATMARDGSDFRCITCDDFASPDLDLRQPQVANDDRRIAVRNGSETQRHAIIECTPSVADCATAELVPVELPLGAVPLLRNAQLRISPDGDHVVFTHVRTDGLLVPVFGRLERGSDRYTVVDARALAGFRSTFTGTSDDLQMSTGNWGEAKGFTDGGASVLYYTTIDAFNYDSVELDLATGEITRLTVHPEYDEDVHLSPDGAWVAQSSFRNYERMSVFSLVPRPPIIDAALRGPFALLRNQSERRFFDIWLLETDRGDDGTARQLLSDDESNDPDINTRGQGRWSPDGTEFIFFDERADELGTARLRIAEFLDREPVAPTPTVASPTPEWAPPIDEAGSPSESTQGTLLGPESGSADVSFDLDLEPLAATVDIVVTYTDYSADGCSFLNGTETTTVDGLDYTWTADLTVTGCHDGSLTADVTGIAFPASAQGTITTEYDRTRIEGLPPR